MKATRNNLAFRRLPCSISRRQASNVVFMKEGPPTITKLQALKLAYVNRGQKRRLPTNALRLQTEKHKKTKKTHQDVTSVMAFPPSSPEEAETTDEEIDWGGFARSAHSPARISPQPHVRFTPDLVDLVAEIPSHRDYTALEKRDIWTSLRVLRNQAKRNRTEWFWEGCDVESVVEEDAFSYDSTGCLKHPAHFEVKKTKRRRI